jgi:hypothetical protein
MPMRANKIAQIIFLVALLVFITSCSTPPRGELVLSKIEFVQGEQIVLKYHATGNFGRNPWIGILPSAIPHGSENENDKNDIAYQYFDAPGSGELIFSAPLLPGKYDFRMHSSDNQGFELAFIPFEVLIKTKSGQINP